MNPSQIQEEILKMESSDIQNISDGYHTFKELYQFRMLYNALLVNVLSERITYKTLRHDNGELCFGGDYFLVVIMLPTGKEIRNHYHISDWSCFQIREEYQAIGWDGHTSDDVLNRMREVLNVTKD